MIASFLEQIEDKTLANSKQARKRVKQNEKRHQKNKWQMTRMNTHIKKVLTTVAAGDKDKAANDYKLATSFIDRLVNKGLIHKNKAARHKSRLNLKIQAIS